MMKTTGHYTKYLNDYEYANLGLENTNTLVTDAQYADILYFLNKLGCELNPEKYKNKYIMENTPPNMNIIQLCYCISNILVCISHDIVYAINKEINKISNYNDENKRAEISKNIYYIIMRSFNGIMNALTNFEIGMFFTELLYVDKNLHNKFPKHSTEQVHWRTVCNKNCYNMFQNHFKRIQWNIIIEEKLFHSVLNDIKSNRKYQISKINELMEEIRKYKDSGEFEKKLLIEVEKDKNLNINEQYNRIKEYFDEFKKKYPQEKINYSELKLELTKDGKINDESVRKIINNNVDAAKNIILYVLTEKINTVIYKYCEYCYKYEQLCDIIHNEILQYITSYNYSFVNRYHAFFKDKYNYETQENKYLYFCYDIFYKKYASILSDDIAKIMNKVFEK